MTGKIELLAPAGDLEKLKFAVLYGADAVYLGGQIFGLRAASRNFTHEEMLEGVAFAHDHGAKVYVTLNIIPHNEDIEALEGYLDLLGTVPFDGVILSDPGTLLLVREHFPGMEIHLSTQANNTNYMSAKFWATQGVRRIVLARELSLEEITQITNRTRDLDLTYEVFVHGAMCIAYSGRCLLSNYMSHRDANMGDCAQSCRWQYRLVEEKRPGEYYPVVEDDKGTYIFNSKDLCMINHVKAVIETGVRSLKIEGRNKSLYYVANIVRAYRRAIDAYYEQGEDYRVDPKWFEEVQKASHRHFTTGFYFHRPDKEDQLYSRSAYIREYDFVGLVLDYDPLTKLATVEQRNKFSVGETLEVMGPGFFEDLLEVRALFAQDLTPLLTAPHAKQLVKIPVKSPLAPYTILRRKREVQHG
ncbi:MAG: peptidase U32 [delta proteobacterium ML8_F1]|nr:MAG: peptidase U32 [delta proteobacterium ML8_F1]